LTSSRKISNIGNDKKIVLVIKKDEFMVKEKIAMLMSKIGFIPVLSHYLSTGYSLRGILLTSKLGFKIMLTNSDFIKSEETV